MINVNEEDFDALCICALRYCMGRQTYMPTMVRNICTAHIGDFEDRTLHVMLNDCEEQEANNNYGNKTIDKPGWLKWRDTLNAELRRRKDDTGRN